MGGFAWVTLATNDSYALGALVLAHSLRRTGTPHDLVALITPGVSAAMRDQLSSIFTLLQEVNVLDSRDEAHLALLERPDLGVTFTKLHCWRLTQYEKCVFLDADTMVLKNSDELFEREELSAAPDPGWPDCFNSGVFVYRPSLDTFNALIKFALTKGSFDGGDQGLLNLFFSDWATKDISRHLPFIYNMVSTATYSYLPAYKQFGENAKIVHFIGANKPWLQYFDSESRLVRSPPGAEHMQPLLQLWWDIFCSTVHPALSPEMLGLAGALAQLTLGAPRSAEQAAFEEHMRKQAWEQGTMDYMGRDSFDNIWRKISETLAQAPQKQENQKPEEVPPTKPASEPKLPESKVPEPKSRISPPADSKEAPGLKSSTAEPTLTHQSAKGIETPSKTQPSLVPSGPTPLPERISEEEKSTPVVPHTPSIIEATPPTSPPIVVPTAPIADIQALKVDAPPPETPPVGSVASELVSTTEPTTTQTVPQDTKPQPSPITESSELEQPIVIEQKQSAETVEAPCQDIPVLKEVTPTQEQAPKEIPKSLEDEKVASSTAPDVPPPPTVSVPKESPLSSGDEKVLSSTVSEVPPKEIPESVADKKAVDSPVPEVHSPQVSAPKEIPVTSGDEKVVGSTVPEIPSLPPVAACDETPTSKGDEKVVGSSVPDVLPSPQVSEPKITSESLTGENDVGPSVSEIPVPPPSQVSTPKEIPTSVTSEKVVSPPVSEIPPPPEVSTPKEVPTSIADEKVVGSTVPEVPAPISPPVSTPKQIPAAVADEKVVSPTAPVAPSPTQVSDPKKTAKSVDAAPQVQPAEVSAPNKISLPEECKEIPSAPIVAEVTKASAPPPPPSDKAATPLAEAPSSPQSSAPAAVPKAPSIEIPAKSAAPTVPQAQVAPQVPAPPAEKEVPVPQPAKPELPVSPPAVPVEASKPPSGEKPDSKEAKSSEKPVSEEAKAVPAPTSPTKAKDVSKPAGKKTVEPKEQTPSGPASPPQTPDVPPSEQAPVPPKRRGHKGATAAPGAEQGASSKPVQPQPQQTKGSKPGQKSKK